MPFNRINDSLINQVIRPEDTERNREVINNPSFAQILGAKFRSDTSYALGADTNTMMFNGLTRDKTGEGIDFFTRAIDEGFDPEQSSSFFYVKNEEEYGKLTGAIRKQNEDLKILQDSDTVNNIAATVVSQLADPINWIGIGLGVKAAKAVGVVKGTSGVAKIAGVEAATGGLTTALQEGAIQASSEVRTAEQSGFAIGVSTLMSGVLGGAYGAYKTGLAPERILDNEIKIEQHLNGVGGEGMSLDDGVILDSAGAARVAPLTKEQTSAITREGTIASSFIKAADYINSKTSISGQLRNSPLLSVRETAEKLLSSNVVTGKNLEGIGTDVGVTFNTKIIQANFDKELVGLDKIYRNYAKAARKAGEKPLNDIEFHELVGDNYESGLSMLTGKDIVDRHITEAVGSMNSLKGITKTSKALGLIDGDAPDGSFNWLMHSWNREKVVANLPKAKEIFTKWYNKYLDDDILKYSDLKDTSKLTAEQKDISDFINKIKDDEGEKVRYITESVDDTINNILNIPRNGGAIGASPSTKGSFKARKINIPFQEISFLMNRDVREILEKSRNSLVPELELRKKFGETKFDLKTETFAKIKEEYDVALAAETDPTKRLKLLKTLDSDLKTLGAAFDMVRGTFNSPQVGYENWVNRSLTALRNTTFLTQMGSVVWSALTDPIIMSKVNGYTPVVKTLFKIATSPEFRNMSKQQANSVSKGLNTAIANRLTDTFELGNPYAKGTAFERGLKNLSKKMGNLSGINFWTDMMESAAYHITADKVENLMSKVLKGQVLTAKQDLQLSAMGIGRDIRTLVATNIKEYATKYENGIVDFNFDSWADEELANTMKAILNRQVGKNIVVKDIGDTPLLIEGEVGKTLGQFLSFGFASQSKVLLSGLQGLDESWVSGELGLFIMGAVQTIIKAKASDREVPTEPKDFILSVFENHPELMIPMLIHRQGAALGLWEQTSLKRTNPTDALIGILGANATTVKRAFNVAGGASRLVRGETPSASQINDTKKILPFNNLFYLQPVATRGLNVFNEKLEPQRKMESNQRKAERKLEQAQ